MLDLTQSLLKTISSSERTVGRYNVSDLWAIVSGYLLPQNYRLRSNLSVTEAFRMWQGRWKHQQVQELLITLGYQVEVKREMDCGDFVIVGKIDAMKEDHGHEIKTSENVYSTAKSWHVFQAKAYCSLFQIPRVYVSQPVIKGRGLYLKDLKTVYRDDEWFATQVEKIANFHQQLVKYETQKKKQLADS